LVSMRNHYHQLSLEERERIDQLHREGKTVNCIARMLDRNKGTISRELRRNASSIYQCYMDHRAHNRATERRAQASQHPRLKNSRVLSYVISKLKEDWSPELIAARIGSDCPGQSISHEAIYQYIYHPHTPDRGKLIECLRRAHRQRRKKGPGRKAHKTKIPNRIPIDARPAMVDSRRQFGHWEGDTLVSRKSAAALSSLTERTSRLLVLTKLKRRGAAEMAQAVIDRLGSLPKAAVRSLTLDNGTENVRHEDITGATGMNCYFCHPYSAWERGTNENINGLIRWYLPKGTDLSKVTDAQIAWIESRINDRPRKCLGYKTPNEVAARFVALQG
jgi:IS30 family transposase